MSDRKAYQREWHRRNNPPKPWPRESVVVAHSNYTVALRKAGLESGVRYLASPKPGGVIMLAPIPPGQDRP